MLRIVALQAFSSALKVALGEAARRLCAGDALGARTLRDKMRCVTNLRLVETNHCA